MNANQTSLRAVWLAFWLHNTFHLSHEAPHLTME